jgi:hypothetical protein
MRSKLAEAFRFVHVSVNETADEFKAALNRVVYITPKSYLDNIALFFNLLQAKQEEL